MIDITDETFDLQISEGKVVVDIWADWCGPCKKLTPKLEWLEEELEGTVQFYKLNSDDNTETANRYNVMSVPTVLIFDDGTLVNTIVGLKSTFEIQKTILESFSI